MEKTLHDLGQIVLNGLPTFFLVLILAIFVKFLLIKPLENVLSERRKLIEGARESARESLNAADTKIAEYQQALSRARADIYREQAEFLKKLQEEQAELIRSVRLETDQRVAEIKLSIAKDADQAREGLEAQSEALADEIANTILRRSAA